MGLFGKHDQQSTSPRNPDAVFGFRALAAGYVLYLEYQIVQMYISGEATMGMWFLILSLVLLGGGALFVLISSYLSWRKEKAALAEEEWAQSEQQEEEPETEE